MPTKIEVVIKKHPKDVIVIHSCFGGHSAGYCFACGARGWTSSLYGYPYGYPFCSEQELDGNEIIHKHDCPMNEWLNEDGTLKQ